MSSTLAELTAGKTYAEQRQALTAALGAVSFPVTSWRDGDVARTLMEIDAQAMAELSVVIAQIAKGGFVREASGAWLTLLAREAYQIDRQPAVATEGLVTLTAAAEAGPYSIGPGQLWVGTAGGLRFQSMNDLPVEVPAGGSEQVPVRAESPGLAYNVANGAITGMLTPFAGVTCSNPDPGSGTWVTRPGVDEEADGALQSRCMARWPESGYGSPSASYDLWARTAAATITRTRVVPSPSVAGQVDVYVASPTGAVPGDDLASAQAYITPRAPLTVTPVVSNASALAVSVNAVLHGRSQYSAAALIQAEEALEAYIASVPIGGTVFRAGIIEALMSPLGVENVVVSAPAADVALTASQVATLSPVITWMNI